MGLLAKAESIKLKGEDIRQKELKISPPPLPVKEPKPEKPMKTKISAPKIKEPDYLPEQPLSRRIIKLPLFHKTKAPEVREEELATKEELLKEKENILRSMERQIGDREKMLLNKGSDTKKLDEEIIQKRDELEQVSRLILARKNLMKENEALLDDKEKSILEKLEELEATKKELEQDKADIISELKKLNKAKAEMTEKGRKTDELRKKEEFLRQKESEIREKEREIEAEKTEIEDAEFQKYMAEILREVMAGVKEESDEIIVPDSVLGFVKEQMRKGASVPSIRQSLSRSGWGNDVIDKAIDEVYIRTALEKEGLKPAELRVEKKKLSKKQVVADNTQKIYSLLQSARHMLRERKIDNAKEALTEIKSVYEKLPVDESKKSLLYYDIMELKTDIDLALLD